VSGDESSLMMLKEMQVRVMTPMPPTPIPTHTYTAIARKHKDGSVLLSVADDRICKLNGVGSLTWMTLERSPDGLSIDEVVRQLSEQFEAINSEGELLYEVSPEQLWEDTARFLKNMTEMNLLQAITDPRGHDLYCIKDGVSGTTTTSVAAAGVARSTSAASERGLSEVSSREPSPATPALTEMSKPIGSASLETADEEIKLFRRETFSALLGLAAFDLLLKFRGFQSLIERVERWPIAEPRTTDREICRRVRAMVDRAQMYYPKKAMCLQHSAVVTCLLRRRGVPAEMVLAAQEFPPRGHAWAEVEGKVVNDYMAVQSTYRVMRRV
jgi:Transglutaminase-like superfamily/Coenzyme PQQ synthesis protein D (PqqD)